MKAVEKSFDTLRERKAAEAKARKEAPVRAAFDMGPSPFQGMIVRARRN